MRIKGVEPEETDDYTRRVFEAQAKKWGAPLIAHTVHARRPTIYRGVRAMWAGLEGSGLLDGRVVALLNRRVAWHNGCEF